MYNPPCMHLLFLFPTISSVRGPIPKVTPPLVHALREAGWTVHTGHWGRRHDQETRWEKTGGRFVDLVRAAARAVRGRPDLVVIATAHDRRGVLRDVPLALTLRALRQPFVLFFHGSRPEAVLHGDDRLFATLSRLLLRLSARALVLSTEEQRGWRRVSHRTRVAVVRNPSVPPPGSAGDAPHWWNVPKQAVVLLFAGRLIEEKGVLVLVDALAELGNESPVHILVAGEGPARPAMEQRAATRGVAHRLTFTGYLTDDQLDAAYRVADGLLLPTWWPEGMPSVITEALSYGLPVITTRIRGAADLLVGGEHALFIPQRDSMALARAMSRFAGDPILRRQMAQAAMHKAAEFTPARAAAVFMEAAARMPARGGVNGPAQPAITSHAGGGEQP